jgi:hypothetical protein
MTLFCPPAEVGRLDTALRYTDILFGFVIKELFSRLQNWPDLPVEVRWHLVVGTTLVLCSWIGYRRSQNRTLYEVKFFNLPLARFIVDQLMLILYFKLAVMTELDGSNALGTEDLVTGTLNLVLLVFCLYAVWDVLGICMAFAKDRSPLDRRWVAKYPVIGEGNTPATPDWRGMWITLGCLALIGSFRCLVPVSHALAALLAILLIYRWAKEMRTTRGMLRTAS